MTELERMPVNGPSRDKIEANTPIVDVAFSSDSKYIAHLDRKGTVHIWNVLLDKSAGQREFPDLKTQSMAMGSRDRFAVAGAGVVRVYNVKSGQIAEIKIATTVAFMMFDEQSKHLAVADTKGKVTVYDISELRAVRQYSEKDFVSTWKLVPGAEFGVMYVYDSGKIRILSCKPRGPDLTVNFARRAGSPVSIAEDGRFVALVNPKGRVEVRSLPDGRLRATLTKISTVPDSLDLSPDGSVLAVAMGAGGVSLWDTSKYQRLDTFPSEIWGDAGISFSHDGYFLAWVERDRKTVRFWSPVRGVVQWTAGGPVLRERARPVCPDYAAVVRYRLATAPYEKGMDQLAKRDLEGALASFAAAARILVAYPGLAIAQAEAQERYVAKVLAARLDKIEQAGDYPEALRALDKFLRDHARFEDYGFKQRSTTLRRMLEHFDRAETHRKAGREVDAVIEFEVAVSIVDRLKLQHPEYAEMRQRLLKTLAKQTDTAYGDQDFNRVVDLYEDMARLRKLTGRSLLRLGDAHEQLGHGAESERVYLAVPADAQEYVRAQRSIARLARSAGHHPKARKHLELARKVAPKRADLEVEFAEICLLCNDYDTAVATWKSVSDLRPTNPRPFEEIATIEARREHWIKAAKALRVAINRSDRSRPKLLVRMGDVFQKSGGVHEVLEVYLELIDLIDRDPESATFISEKPRQTVENWIRKLDYVQHKREWIQREQFLEEQGWEKHADAWLRPREARLREVAERYKKVPRARLRAFSDERYRMYTDEHRITKGMNRREVIRAWGFFLDQNVFLDPERDAVFEQLLFQRTRKVYLKNGLVCYWSE